MINYEYFTFRIHQNTMIFYFSDSCINHRENDYYSISSLDYLLDNLDNIDKSGFVKNSYVGLVKSIDICSTFIGKHIQHELDEWFIAKYPKYVHLVEGLNPELKGKYSQLVMAGKFGLFSDAI